MGRLGRGMHKRYASIVVGIVVGTAVLGGLVDVLISVQRESIGAPPPTGRACQKLLEQQRPDLMAQANRILRDQAAIAALADCGSGAYPSAEGATVDRAPDIVRRMQRLGSVQQRSPDECLKYLTPADCGQVWVFRPAGSAHRYVVLLDPRTSPDGRGAPRAGTDFGIMLDRQPP